MRHLLLFSTLLGCRASEVGYGVGVLHPDNWPTLLLVVGADRAQAGETVPVQLLLDFPEGATLVVSGDVTSDSEELQYDGTAISPTVAAFHHLSAETVYSDTVFTATGTLGVSPGPAAEVDLVLGAETTTPDVPIAYTLWAVDAYGNEAWLTQAGVSCDGVSVDGDGQAGTLSTTVAGDYTAVGTVDGRSDSEPFTVQPGPAAAIELSLADTLLDPGDSTRATVAVVDAWGNQTSGGWTLELTGDGEASVGEPDEDGALLYFPEEGWYTATARLDDSELYDSVGPFLVDVTPPLLTVDLPERASWAEVGPATVSGSVWDEWSAIDEVSVNGAGVAVIDEAFATEVDWDFGLNLLQCSAEDPRGNAAWDARSVLAGDFLPYGDGLSSGVAMRVLQGPGGVDELSALCDELIVADDLDAYFGSPVYEFEEESCYSVFGYEYCVTWYSLALYLSSPTLGGTSHSLDPTAEGVLGSTTTLTDGRMEWSATGVIAEVGYASSGEMTFDELVIGMDLVPSVESGQFVLTPTGEGVETTGLTFNLDSWVEWLTDYMGVDAETDVTAEMENAVLDAAMERVPERLADELNSATVGRTLDVGEGQYDLDATAETFTVDDAGLDLSFETWFTAGEWVVDVEVPGSLLGDYALPTLGADAMTQAVSLDFVNQALLGLWGGGAQDLDASLLDSDYTGVVTPLLPPVVVPGTPHTLQWGDVWIEAETASGSASGWVSLETTLVLLLSGDDSWSFVVGTPTYTTHRVAGSEADLEYLAQLALVRALSDLSRLELPAFDTLQSSAASHRLSVGYDLYEGTLSTR